MKIRLGILLVVVCLVGFSTVQVRADAQSDYSEYIMSLESLDGKEFKKLLLSELDEYMRRFPTAPNLAEMQLKKASIYLDNNDQLNTFISHLIILYLSSSYDDKQ